MRPEARRNRALPCIRRSARGGLPGPVGRPGPRIRPAESPSGMMLHSVEAVADDAFVAGAAKKACRAEDREPRESPHHREAPSRVARLLARSNPRPFEAAGRAASLVVPIRPHAREHPPPVVRGHWLFVLHEEEQAHANEQARSEKVRSGGAEARRFQRSEDASSLEVASLSQTGAGAASGYSERILNSTRRFRARPWSVPLSAIGLFGP